MTSGTELNQLLRVFIPTFPNYIKHNKKYDQYHSQFKSSVELTQNKSFLLRLTFVICHIRGSTVVVAWWMR